MGKKKTTLNRMLDDDEDFLSFLGQEARSDEYRTLKREAENEPHPGKDMLRDYVLGHLDDKDTHMVRDHIFFCGTCAEEVLTIRQTRSDLETTSEDDTSRT